MRLDPKVSRTLMVANVIATVLVIAIHYNSKKAIDSSDVYALNNLIQEFMTNGVARISVPFFALLSGFFLYEKLHTGGYLKTLSNKTSTLLIPYVLASSIIFISATILKVLLVPELYTRPNLSSVFYDIILHPLALQFWFLRDLIIIVILSPLLMGGRMPVNALLICVFGGLWFFDIQPFLLLGGRYIINIEPLFFFCLGGGLSARYSLLTQVINAKLHTKLTIAVIWMALIALRIYIDPKLNVWYQSNYILESLILYKISIVLGLVSLLHFSERYSDSNMMVYFSGLTFFVYLFICLFVSYGTFILF